MTPTLTSLLSRVRAASGRLDDETLAHVIAAVTGNVVTEWSNETGDDGSDAFHVAFDEESEGFFAYRSRCPDVSIDAAVALVERALPGWSWRVGNTPSGRGFCYLGTSLVEHDAATPPLAILAALLTALEQKESTG